VAGESDDRPLGQHVGLSLGKKRPKSQADMG